jgi:predicted PurR-regulated permease PerM
MKLRLTRGVASFLVCSIALMLLYLVGLGAYTELTQLAEDLPSYSQRINEIVDGAAARIESFEKGIYQNFVPRRFQERPPEGADSQQAAQNSRSKKRKAAEPPPPQTVQEVRIRPEPTPLASYVYNYLSSVYNVLLMASFVPFLVYFMLSWRDHLRTSFLSLFGEGENRIVAGRTWHGVAEMARAYVLGNFMLGLLLSTASAILFAAVGLPYWPLVAPISGFLSLVPYVGLPLAMIPPILAALPVHSDPAMYLFITVTVALLHLLALNLLYPKFVGARVHLNPLAVTVALMFWGTLWGAIGLLLAIPITAAIKAVCDNVTRLGPYGRLLGD